MKSKILLLEDDINLSEIVEEHLTEEGYEVHLVTDAQQALDAAYEGHFDLWILDVKVPLGDGFSLLKELRKSGKETPAIFLTSLNTAGVSDGSGWKTSAAPASSHSLQSRSKSRG